MELAGAERFGGFDEFLRPQLPGDRVDQPGVPGPPEGGDGEHRVDQVGRQHRGDGQRHHQRRDGEGDIGQAHDDDLDPAAEIAGEQAQRRADRNGDAEHHQRQQQRDAQPEDDAAEDVAADIVGAEPVFRRGGQVAGAEVDDRADMLGVGRDPRREDGGEDREDDDGRTDHGGRVAREAVPVLVGVREPARRSGGHCLGGHQRLPRMRTRGSTKPTSTSMTRLTMTKNTPDTITTPMTALRSFCRMVRMP